MGRIFCHLFLVFCLCLFLSGSALAQGEEGESLGTWASFGLLLRPDRFAVSAVPEGSDTWAGEINAQDGILPIVGMRLTLGPLYWEALGLDWTQNLFYRDGKGQNLDPPQGEIEVSARSDTGAGRVYLHLYESLLRLSLNLKSKRAVLRFYLGGGVQSLAMKGELYLTHAPDRSASCQDAVAYAYEGSITDECQRLGFDLKGTKSIQHVGIEFLPLNPGETNIGFIFVPQATMSSKSDGYQIHYADQHSFAAYVVKNF